MFLDRDSLLFMGAGGVFGVLVPCACFWNWYGVAKRRVVCGPVGFQVEARSRRKVSRAVAYRWGDIASARYEVRENKDSDGDITYVQMYSVSVAQGEAFAFDDNFREFAEVIAMCSAMTPQLPYLWTPRRPGQDWEYVVGPTGLFTSQTQPVHRQAKFVCASRHPVIAAMPPPLPSPDRSPASSPPPMPPPLPN